MRVSAPPVIRGGHHGCRNGQSVLRTGFQRLLRSDSSSWLPKQAVRFAAGRTVRMRFCLCAAYLRSPRQKSDERGYRFARRHQETVIERKSDFAGTVQRPKERLLCVERKVSVARAEAWTGLIALCGIVRGKFIAKRVTKTLDAFRADRLHTQRLRRGKPAVFRDETIRRQTDCGREQDHLVAALQITAEPLTVGLEKA